MNTSSRVRAACAAAFVSACSDRGSAATMDGADGGRTWGKSTVVDRARAQTASPRIAADTESNVMAVWRQSGSSATNWSNRFSAGKWGDPVPIDLEHSREPELAVDARGNATVVWSRPPTRTTSSEASLWTSRFVVGQGWGKKQLLGGAKVAVYHVASAPDGTTIAVWDNWEEAGIGSTAHIWARRRAAGDTTWGSVTRLDVGAELSRWPSVVMDHAGNAIVVWTQNTASAGAIWASRWSAGMWSTPAPIEPVPRDFNYQGDLVADATGNALASWIGQRGGIWVARYDVAAARWMEPQAITVDAPIISEGHGIAMGAGGDAIAVWPQHDGSHRTIWARHYTTSGGWSPPIVIGSDDQLEAAYPRVAISPTGHAAVTWLEHAPFGGEIWDAWANHYVRGRGWAGARPLENNSGSVESLRVTIDPSGTATAVWAQAHVGEYSIWVNRFP